MNAVMKKIGEAGRPVPCLFYPAIREAGADVEQVLCDAKAQADILKRIPRVWPVGAVIRMTELWCEAAAFGMECRIQNEDFPVLGAPLCEEAEELRELPIPDVENRVTAPLLEAVRLAAPALDEPLIVGMTGPYTLGSVLGGAEDFMVACMTEPETVHDFLEGLCGFLIAYARAYKEAGAGGVIIAEPSAAMISPQMMEDFSNRYLSRMISQLQDDGFAVIYHNCGAADPHMETIAGLDAAAFHFGSEVNLRRARGLLPEDRFLMGNLDPRLFLSAGPDEIRARAAEQRAENGALIHYIPSTGCDLSPAVSPGAVSAFFD